MSTPTALTTTTRPIRVAVLSSSYEGCVSDIKELDDIPRTPGHYFVKPEDQAEYTFEIVPLTKKDAYAQLRAAICSGRYDAYFNLADGAADEDRAGLEVVQVLERFGVPFTGATSAFYEWSKPQMKAAALRYGIDTAAFAVLDATSDVEAECAHLHFPVLVKHTSGYSSVGMTKDCKCADMAALKERVARFIQRYQHALVEEFIPGIEVTALACTDANAEGGVRVYPPVFMNFPEGEDFKHFDLKWLAYEGLVWARLPEPHASFAEVCRVTRASFLEMMGGRGYGRVDLRIDEATGRVVFLEINTNCGVLYPPGQEGSADHILALSDGHVAFSRLQLQEAMRLAAAGPAFRVAFDGAPPLGWSSRATRAVDKGGVVADFTAGGVAGGIAHHSIHLAPSPATGGSSPGGREAGIVAVEGGNGAMARVALGWGDVAAVIGPGAPFPCAKLALTVANVAACPASPLRFVALRSIASGERLYV